MHCFALQCTSLNCSELNCTALHGTVLHCTITLFNSTAQPNTVLPFTALFLLLWMVGHGIHRLNIKYNFADLFFNYKNYPSIHPWQSCWNYTCFEEIHPWQSCWKYTCFEEISITLSRCTMYNWLRKTGFLILNLFWCTLSYDFLLSKFYYLGMIPNLACI